MKHNVVVSLSDAEHEAVKATAEAQGTTVSALVRDRCSGGVHSCDLSETVRAKVCSLAEALKQSERFVIERILLGYFAQQMAHRIAYGSEDPDGLNPFANPSEPAAQNFEGELMRYAHEYSRTVEEQLRRDLANGIR